MKTVYIGTSAFAQMVLAGIAPGLRPLLVVTRPPAARGRGRRVTPTPVAEGARELGLALAEPARLGDVAEQIAALEPDLIVLCAYGAIVREPLLSAYEILNVHPSLLPRWRGAAPIERAIMAGDAATGVSLMRLVEELDGGPVCRTQTVAIAPEDDYGTLSVRLAAIGAALLLEAVGGPREYREQDGTGVSYAEKLTAADRELDGGRPAEALERQVRALHPHIGARLPGGVRILAARLADRPTAARTLAAEDGRLYFGATPGTLELLRVQPPGRHAMDASSYLRGHAV